MIKITILNVINGFISHFHTHNKYYCVSLRNWSLLDNKTTHLEIVSLETNVYKGTLFGSY